MIHKIKIKDNKPVGTVINNTAFIYFDFNAPVVTNTTNNTIATITDLSPSLSEGEGVMQIQLAPNPASNTITISNLAPKTSITITNLLGEVVIKEEAAGNSKVIDVSRLPNGMYFINQRKFVKQ